MKTDGKGRRHRSKSKHSSADRIVAEHLPTMDDLMAANHKFEWKTHTISRPNVDSTARPNNSKNAIQAAAGFVKPLEQAAIERGHSGKLANLAYEKDLAKKEHEARLLGYDIDKELSTYNHTVFVNRRNKKATIAYRGTDPSNPDDLAADYAIANGTRFHPRFNEALHVAKRSIDKYGHDNVELTGHSLGGTQALHAYERYGLKTRVFNPGSTPIGERLKLHSNGVKPEIIRHEHDVISAGYAKYSTNVVKADPSSVRNVRYLLVAHSIPKVY